MLSFSGVSSLSEFQQQKLLEQVKAIDKSIMAVEAEYIHMVDADSSFSEDQKTTMKELLNYGTAYESSEGSLRVLIGPRIGTISPWSSKATDIAKNSGLDSVERIERFTVYYFLGGSTEVSQQVKSLLFDPMRQQIYSSQDEMEKLFAEQEPRPLEFIKLEANALKALSAANKNLGLALSEDEIEYLADAYTELGRNSTDAELMMFAQVNSEHCRHKIFNADWEIDDKPQPKSLFSMIRNTYQKNSQGVLSAYSDNAAVLEGEVGKRFFSDPETGVYKSIEEPIHSVIKVETHNHPTAVAPHPGAATGTGGEIRDESATGRGGRSKMGLSGFNVSNLNIPDARRSWEKDYGKPGRISSALDIMIEAPIGSAAFANEYGRPNLAGYFRTYEHEFEGNVRGYHKPIMIAGGMGNIREMHVAKNSLQTGDKIIVLGGPSMLIGLGGSAASSMQAGASSEDLDFASVQRDNPEMERRAQEVIDRCWSMGENNPIQSIHDVGAGGLSNALPELVHDSGLGAKFEIRDIPSAEAGLSPLEIWCNESQERYVLGVNVNDVTQFEEICKRERCPFAAVGEANAENNLIVSDSLNGNNPVELPMDVLFGKPPKMSRKASTPDRTPLQLDFARINLDEAVSKVLTMPSVGSKKFLITIGDRNVGGLVVRDQMIGPWQVPVADVAVSAASFETEFGEAMAIGERPTLALVDAPASGRVAIGEAITNIMAADIKNLSDIRLSANWMAAADKNDENYNLFQTVKAVGEEFCPALGLTIPVGKDSLSMKTVWEDGGQKKSVTSPMSVVISSFSPVKSAERTLTPQLDLSTDSSLILIDLGKGKNRLGGSALAQAYGQVGSVVPDVEPETMINFFDAIRELKNHNKILAYHDRSDGGLFTTLVEMAFASRCGLQIKLPGDSGELESLFSEELGAVIQVSDNELSNVIDVLTNHNLDPAVVAVPNKNEKITILKDSTELFCSSRAEMELMWSDTSYQIQKLRDNSECAEQEKSLISSKDNGLNPDSKLYKESSRKLSPTRPRLAIFREQGINGHVEMAAAFDAAGFESVDVHLTDIISGRHSLDDFVGLAVCGGFSYGDVLGAGEGWAKSILHNKELRSNFSNFFERNNTFSLGVCNGCQMLATLKDIIPGAESWPRFLSNESAQFEARLTQVKISKSPSILFSGMDDYYLPVPVAHGEGRVEFESSDAELHMNKNNLVTMQFTDSNHKIASTYPYNPNGSPSGITGLTSEDGRATIMMPHPERAFMTRQLSWSPSDWEKITPWMQMFENARNWVEGEL